MLIHKQAHVYQNWVLNVSHLTLCTVKQNYRKINARDEKNKKSSYIQRQGQI